MRKFVHSTRSIVVLSTSVLVLLVTIEKSHADLTGDQVVERCKHAYNTLRSYSGSCKVLTKSSIGGMNSTYITSATVQFERPGKIRVDGTLMTNGRVAFVSDGTSTWQTDIVDPNKWIRAQSTEMAIAAFSGVSQY